MILFCRYRPGLDLVLKSLSATIGPHEKVGIVGRTGAENFNFSFNLDPFQTHSDDEIWHALE
ncbi:unnamed protein product, partial [Cylicostephanus goldi]